MSEILSHQEATKAWVLLQQGGVTIDGGMEALDALWFSHEALRARLAEVEAERDRAWRECSKAQDESSVWFNKRAAAEGRAAKERSGRLAAEARLAEVEQALRKYGRHLTRCGVLRGWPCDCGFSAVLDKGEQT